MKKEIKEKISEYWNDLVDVLEREFPKKQCQERGHALVLLAYCEMALQEQKKELTQEKQKWIEKIIPKKKEMNEAHKEHWIPNCPCPECREIDGFNSCLKEIKQKLKKVGN